MSLPNYDMFSIYPLLKSDTCKFLFEQHGKKMGSFWEIFPKHPTGNQYFTTLHNLQQKMGNFIISNTSHIQKYILLIITRKFRDTSL